jgi:cobyrinic acid a,c-diamide synthase
VKLCILRILPALRTRKALAKAAAGTRLVGHEFHYASVIASPDDPLADVRDAAGETVAEAGSRRGRVTGTFFHAVATSEG